MPGILSPTVYEALQVALRWFRRACVNDVISKMDLCILQMVHSQLRRKCNLALLEEPLNRWTRQGHAHQYQSSEQQRGSTQRGCVERAVANVLNRTKNNSSSREFSEVARLGGCRWKCRYVASFKLSYANPHIPKNEPKIDENHSRIYFKSVKICTEHVLLWPCLMDCSRIGFACFYH